MAKKPTPPPAPKKEQPQPEQKKNPIVERALSQGIKSGGTIGDISGGSGANVSIKSSSYGSYGDGSSTSPNTSSTPTEEMTSAQDIQKSLFEKQGKTVSITEEGLTAKDGQRQTFVSKYGDYVTAPTSATIGKAATIRAAVEAQAIQQQRQETIKAEQQAQAKNQFTPNASITEYKPKVEEKVKRFVSANEGTIKGTLAATGYSAFRFGRGYVRGYVTALNPVTYYRLGKQLVTAQGREELRAGFYSMGSQIVRDPTYLFEVAGEFKGAGRAAKDVLTVYSKLKKPVVSSKSAENIISRETPEGLVDTRSAAIYKVKVGRKTFEVKAAGKEYNVPINDNTLFSAGAFRFKTRGAEGAGTTSGVKLLTNDATVSIDTYRTAIKSGGKVRYQPGITFGKNEPIVIGEDLNTYFSKNVDISEKTTTGRTMNLKKDFFKPVDFKSIFETGKTSSMRYGLIKEKFKMGDTTLSQGKFKEIRDVNLFRKLEAQKPTVDFRPTEAQLKIVQKYSSGNLLTRLEEGAKQTAKAAYVEETVKQAPSMVRLNVPKVRDTRMQLAQINKTSSNMAKQSQKYIQKMQPQQREETIVYSKPNVNQTPYSQAMNKQGARMLQEMGNIAKDMERSKPEQTPVVEQRSEQLGLQRQLTRQAQMQEQKQLSQLKLSQRYVRMNIKPMPFQISPRFRSFDLERYGGSDFAQGYAAYIKRGGRFQRLQGTYTLNRALKIGATETLRQIAATFRIQKEGAIYNTLDINYTPPTKYFRNYKIVKGQRVNTPFTYIQERGQRLSSQSEVYELQSFRQKAKRYFS